MFYSHSQALLDRACSAHTVQWSPLLRDVDVTYRPIKFNGSFLHDEGNVFRADPSPEVDAAWEALGLKYRPGVVSKADGLNSGLEERHLQRSEKYGGGFFANVEGMHHLHCLNILRKVTYYNYEYYKNLYEGVFVNDESILHKHISGSSRSQYLVKHVAEFPKAHCIDTIRQVLICNIDTGLMGQVWANAEDPKPFHDFKTTHVCKNFDAIREWAMKIQERPRDQLPPDYSAPPRPEDIEPWGE
ncbi:hypothetical protein S40285_08716 [Stachybotrys chlorohalonatus IBT 40285]|uniref:Tat pathway signal sequence n=1 Tax=Stachybotrys chlorohalonatus (strain IBT 40285) TaxID=1283841 RepID=A0A084R0I3_STAC4|nr:hypothetical protein S40285_08716 [Stachybotrys chlorohalonata IBT 40285]